MVGLLVDVEWDVVGLSIGQVGAVSQVEGDVKEIHNFLVGFHCDLEAILVEDLAEVFLDHLNSQRSHLNAQRPQTKLQRGQWTDNF